MVELSDEDILDFLMTSEFIGDFKPDELKYLLLKWRYFYRMQHGRLEVSKADLEKYKLDCVELNKLLESERNSLKSEIANLENEVHQLKQRKLTWRERLSGKIITIKDESL
jgi:FtsZ-binding cell division protein ZapB